MKKILMIMMLLFIVGSINAQTFSVKFSITVPSDTVPELKNFKEVKGLLDFTSNIVELVIYDPKTDTYVIKSYNILKSRLLEGKGIRVYYIENRMTGNFAKLFASEGVGNDIMMMLSEEGLDTYLAMEVLI